MGRGAAVCQTTSSMSPLLVHGLCSFSKVSEIASASICRRIDFRVIGPIRRVEVLYVRNDHWGYIDGSVLT